ncbi:MAG: tripartite tricarboxylate transporter TctB family protein [Burkholderiales bacterium]|nr:tripartite tricarboxylate transporter TctB family protein [Burkholderiales bacterium]
MTKLPDRFAPEDNSGQTQLNTDLDRRAGGSGIHSVQMQGILTAAPALFMIVLSAAVFFGTSELRMWRGITPGPRFFPALLASAGVGLAMLLLIGQWRGADAPTLDIPDRFGAIKVAATAALLMVFAAGSPVFGMMPMVAAFTLVMLLFVARQSILSSLTATIIITLVIQLVFVQWLKVALPLPVFS